MRYHTIVVDPPWPMPDSGKTTRGTTDTAGIYTAKSGRKINGTWWGRHQGGSVTLPYDRMTLDEIHKLPVGDLADRSAHLYLWTTNRFLRDAYDVLKSWR